MKNTAELKRLIKSFEVALEKISLQAPQQIYWVSRKKAAELYDVSVRTLLNWKNEGLIEAKEINGKVYYSILPLTKPTK